jgi:amino acid transporter
MAALDIFAWIVYIVMIVSVVGVIVSLAALPGKTARERNHPQADAINVAGWLGLIFTLGIIWVIAMIWSRMVPTGTLAEPPSEEIDNLKARIHDLENKLATHGEA